MKYLKLKNIFASTFIIFTSLFNFVYAEDVPDPVPPADPAPIIQNVNFIIRDGASIVWQGSVPLPDAGSVDLNDKDSNPHAINSRSVLSVLTKADELSDDFNISNLEYFSSFGSLYMKCMASTIGGEKCDNWQYTVNNGYAFVGMDQNILSGEENIYIYFGTQYKISLDDNSIDTAGTLTAKTEEYNYEDDTWKVRSGVTVGLTQPDPSNPWSPIEVFTSPVDAGGLATFTSIPAGIYNVGVKEDYYYPTEALTVSEVAVSSGGGSSTPVPSFSVENAISYLNSVQDSEGSFGKSPMYTDWVAIALSATGGSTTDILSYFENNNTLSRNLTDNERRVMALLALGQNPYDFHGVNYINSIVKSFDGTQLGDANLDNDDIFGLIVLPSAGYNKKDEIISQTILFVLSTQQGDGSWDSSIDMTAAGVQALKKFSSVQGVSEALEKASLYLQNSQNEDGGWGNVSSTSWAMQAMNVLGSNWTKNGKSGADYLASIQAPDGGVAGVTESLQNRIWMTSYSIPAALGKSWGDVMISVSKPEINKSQSTEVETVLEVKEKLIEPDVLPEVKPEIKPEVKKVVPEIKIITKKKVLPTNQEVKVDVKPSQPSPLSANALSADTKFTFKGLFRSMATGVSSFILSIFKWF